MMMREKPLYPVLLAVVAVLICLCARMDVRMGMGDGDGVRLSYRTVGTGDALVVIHGGPGYEKILMYPGFDGLSSDFRVVYYDQRGCGSSEALSPMTSMTISDHVEDLEAMRGYLRLPGISIAAHGWGAVIAMEYCRAYGRYVNSVILISPISPFRPKPAAESIVDHLPSETRDEILDIYDHPSLSLLEKRERVMRLILPALFHRKEGLEYVDVNALSFAADVNARATAGLWSLDLFPVLKDVNVPTLVIVGRHDPVTTVMDQMAYADGIRTSSAIVFNSSGHFPFLEERKLFADVSRQFLLHGSLPALVRADP